MRKQTKSKKRAAKLSAAQIKKLAVQMGALSAKIIAPADVVTGEWVRWKCQFGCGGFGTSLVCPPHTPRPAETRKLLDGYTRAVLFESPPGQTKKIAVELERKLFLSGLYKAFGMGAGPCGLCETCTFQEGCRHPHQARPSMEACGIDVYATARKQGYTINVTRTRRDPQHYFGLVLIE